MNAGENNNIAETVPFNRIPISKVNLSDLLSRNSPRIKQWETDWLIHPIVIADPNIILLDQYIQPNRKGEFISNPKRAIENGRPEDAWSETLWTAISYALRNAMQDNEGALSSRTVPQIGIISHIVQDKLIIEVKDNGQGIPKEIADKLSPGYMLEEAGQVRNRARDIRVGNRLRYIYQAIEQIGGRAEMVTKYIKDLKPGEASGITIRFIFPANTA